MKVKGRKSKAKVEQTAMERDWEVERDLEALARANAINKDPDRLKKVQELAKKKIDESKGKKAEAEYVIDLGEQQK